MKNIIIMLIGLLLMVSLSVMASCIPSSSNEKNFSLEESEMLYIKENGIAYEDVKNYLPYKSFNIYRFHEYEKKRLYENISYLEALNCINNPHYYDFFIQPKPALFVQEKTIFVNKCFYLSSNYTPSDLVAVSEFPLNYIKRENEVMMGNSEAVLAYLEMARAAESDGINLLLYSCYRSFVKQNALYHASGYNEELVARPGFSEHQTGYAFDISDEESGLTSYFASTDTFCWLVKNCKLFGFILRYPDGKTHLTGYAFEPWHYRYVGKEVACNIGEETLEEYFFHNYELI